MSIHNCWNKSNKSCCVKKARLEVAEMVETESELLQLSMELLLHNMDHRLSNKLALLELFLKTHSQLFRLHNWDLSHSQLPVGSLHQAAMLQVHQTHTVHQVPTMASHRTKLKYKTQKILSKSRPEKRKWTTIVLILLPSHNSVVLLNVLLYEFVCHRSHLIFREKI